MKKKLRNKDIEVIRYGNPVIQLKLDCDAWYIKFWKRLTGKKTYVIK